MADEPAASAVAAEKVAEAATIDTLAQAAEQASTAANAALHHGANVAALAEEHAAEKVEAIAEKTGEILAEQEGDLSWLKTHAQQTAENLANLSSHSTATTARMEKLETTLGTVAEMLQRLTQPPPVTETKVTLPETPQSAAEGVPKGAEQKARGKPKHRWI